MNDDDELANELDEDDLEVPEPPRQQRGNVGRPSKQQPQQRPIIQQPQPERVVQVPRVISKEEMLNAIYDGLVEQRQLLIEITKLLQQRR